MSSAVAGNNEVAEAPKKSFGKKKLIVMLAIALLVLAVGGGAAVVLMKRRAAQLAAEADGDTPEATQAEGHTGLQKRDLKNPPAFVALETFTVNLADHEAERYAQIGVTLELEDAHEVDAIKGYMPAIRSNILLVLARKTSADLLAPEGKKILAFEVKREASRALGIEIEDELAKPADKAAAGGKGKKKKKVYDESPIRAVYFSNFIIQ